EMAARPPRPAIAPARLGRRADRRRRAGAAGGGAEPRGGASVGPLAVAGPPRVARGRECLVAGFFLPAAPDACPPVAGRAAPLAASLAEQVAGGRPAGPVPLVLRGILALGSPALDRRDHPGLLRGGLRHRRPLPRGVVLQVRLPHRPVQFRAVA